MSPGSQRLTADPAARAAPALLIVSGLDPSGGAGFIADVRVAQLHGVRPVGVITALTEQTTAGVRAVHAVPAAVVGEQLRALLADIDVAAVKIGMLATEAIAAAVADALAATGRLAVWDPIFRPTSGQVPLYDGDPAALVGLLGGYIRVITPNIPEAEALSGVSIGDPAAMAAAARALCQSLGAAALVKGGHLPGHAAVDVLTTGPTAEDTTELTGELLALAEPVHGTGCALSTALACELARMSEPDVLAAARAAKRFVAERMAHPARPGPGAPAVL